MAKKKSSESSSDEPLKHNPFGALSGKSAPQASQEDLAQPVPAQAAHAGSAPKSLGRVVLRRETKHRGGKAVVVVSGFDALPGYDEETIAALAKRLKQALGCGGTVEARGSSHEIVLQGDKPAKVAELLRNQGFRVAGVTS